MTSLQFVNVNKVGFFGMKEWTFNTIDENKGLPILLLLWKKYRQTTQFVEFGAKVHFDKENTKLLWKLLEFNWFPSLSSLFEIINSDFGFFFLK